MSELHHPDKRYRNLTVCNINQELQDRLLEFQDQAITFLWEYLLPIEKDILICFRNVREFIRTENNIDELLYLQANTRTESHRKVTIKIGDLFESHDYFPLNQPPVLKKCRDAVILSQQWLERTVIWSSTRRLSLDKSMIDNFLFQMRECCYCCKKSDAHCFPRCSRCKRVSYCSRICQANAWPYHKSTCVQPF